MIHVDIFSKKIYKHQILGTCGCGLSTVYFVLAIEIRANEIKCIGISFWG